MYKHHFFSLPHEICIAVHSLVPRNWGEGGVRFKRKLGELWGGVYLLFRTNSWEWGAWICQPNNIMPVNVNNNWWMNHGKWKQTEYIISCFVDHVTWLCGYKHSVSIKWLAIHFACEFFWYFRTIYTIICMYMRTIYIC